MPNEIGTVEVGKKADILIIEGDPLNDITVLQDRRKILAVMKDGKIHASRGKVLSPEWDLLEDENFNAFASSIAGTIGAVAQQPTRR